MLLARQIFQHARTVNTNRSFTAAELVFRSAAVLPVIFMREVVDEQFVTVCVPGVELGDYFPVRGK